MGDYDDEDYDPISEAVNDRPDDDTAELNFSNNTELGIMREEPEDWEGWKDEDVTIVKDREEG